MSDWTRRGFVAAALSLLLSSQARAGIFDSVGASFVSPSDLSSIVLTRDDGKAVNLGDMLKGGPLVFFFGYTNCVDVCTEGMRVLKEWVGSYHGSAQGVFVSLDPHRDDPAAVHRFLAGSQIVGLTAKASDATQVNALRELVGFFHVWGEYNLWSGKPVPLDVMLRNPSLLNGQEGYIVNHASSFYRLAQNGSLTVVRPDEVLSASRPAPAKAGEAASYAR